MAPPKKPTSFNKATGGTPNASTPQVNVSDAFKDVLKKSISGFEKLSEEKRIELYGDQKFLDQFWMYFKEKNPSLLSQITKENLPAYLESLDGVGFSVQQLAEQSSSFHYEFAEKEPEIEVMKTTLTHFRDFCKDPLNAMPAGCYADFASEVGFDSSTGALSSPTKLKKIDDIYSLWKKFAEKQSYILQEGQKNNIENLLRPMYDPVERVMVEVALQKILSELSGTVRTDFMSRFPLPLTALSPYCDLRVFAQHWSSFLLDHQQNISPALAKKLASLIVTNGDIRKKIEETGKDLDSSFSYGTWEKYFVRVFSKLTTRQLFEEAKSSQELVQHYFGVMSDAIKSFPPYVNAIYKLYPYDDILIQKASPTLHLNLQEVDAQLTSLGKELGADIDGKIKPIPEEKKIRLREEMEILRKKREDIKWRAYLAYLATQDFELASAMQKVYEAKFDFSRLSVADQQVILTVLVRHKMEDIIKNKAPELLQVDPNGLKQFVSDLFDLQKKDLILPTTQGPVHLRFTHKQFLAEKVSAFTSVGDMSALENLPLSFGLETTPSSEAFFEQGALRGRQGAQIFDTFGGKNRDQIVGDNYKVRLQKNGKTVEGYLSQYPPSDTLPDDGSMWYLYSQPITAVDHERSLVMWDNNDPATGVAIPETEESDYDLEIVDKKVVLTGQAISSLVFAYILGQQPVDLQSSLEKKIDTLKTYKDIRSSAADLGTALSDQKISPQETSENNEKQATLDAWKSLAGYDFDQDKETFGLTVGTNLFLKAGETGLPPDTKSDNRMHLEITQVDWKKKSFTIKLHGGEFPLGKEGATKELALNPDTFSSLEEILGEKLHKVPAPTSDFDAQLTALKKSGFESKYSTEFGYTFDTIRWDGQKYVFALGDYIGEKVEYFGCDVTDYSFNGTRTVTEISHVMYKVRFNAKGTVTVTLDGELTDDTGAKVDAYEREMDINMFMLFVTTKKLQPKAEKDIQEKKLLKSHEDDKGYKQKKPRFSLQNIGAFFKGTMNKVKDSIKKYDEERSEELTDLALKNGDLLTQFGKRLGGSRAGAGFEMAGMEYYTQRDARVWKKIEKRQKYYEQEKHYPTFFYHSLNKLVTGDEVPHDMYKIPAALLTIINKEKSPYARHFDLIGTGRWVNLILGKKHQGRYLDLMNTKIAELKAGSKLNGSDWTVMKNEEIVKLEMKYIVAVIDGREHTVSPEHEKEQAAKWSRNFAEKLDEAIDTKFGFKGINEKYAGIPKTTTFEFAEYEYTRHLKNNKAAASLPYFKYMAESANTPQQWEVFQMHVLSSMMSGWFMNCVDGQTQGWIKDICRTRGFLPGLWAKDVEQQTKVLQLLNVFTHDSFGKKGFDYKGGKGHFDFNLGNLSLGNMKDTSAFVSDWFKQWRLKDGNGSKLCKFLSFAGKDVEGRHTIMEFVDDPTLPDDQKTILKEYFAFSLESNQDIDKEVRHNYSTFSGFNLAKCETIVKETMKYDNGEFDGADSHEKEGPRLFWDDVANIVPKTKQDFASVVFYMQKFLSWFDGAGFAKGSQWTVFLKRLRTVQKMYASPDALVRKQAEDMLRYTINGVIIDANSSGKDSPPEAFEQGLTAFKNFFKANLDTVLSHGVISATMGDYYAKDEESQKSYSIGDWGEYVSIVTNRMTALVGKDREKNADIQKKYQKEEFRIYDELYKLADHVQTSHNIENVFRKYNTGQWNTTTLGNSHNAHADNSGIAITNMETIDQLQTNINMKSPSKPKDKSPQALQEEEAAWQDAVLG